MLIHGPVDVPPSAGDPHVGLIDIPTVTDQVPTRPGRIREERGKALNPPVDRDVIDLDPTLPQQFLDIAIGEALPQIPPQREDDDLGREPEPLERRTPNHRDQTRTMRPHPATLTDGHEVRPTQQCPHRMYVLRGYRYRYRPREAREARDERTPRR